MAQKIQNAMSKYVSKHAYWHAQLTAAKKHKKKADEQSDNNYSVYNDERKDELQKKKMRFGLYAANCDILQNSMMGRIPEPDVSRRYKDSDDQIGRVASLLLQRSLSYEIETDNYFSTLASNLSQDYITAGQAFAWVRYDTEEGESIDDGNDLQLSDRVEDQAEVQSTPLTDPIIVDQHSPIDYVHYKDFLYPKCRTWDECPWVARRVYMNEAALAARFGEDKAEAVSVNFDKMLDSDSTRSTAEETDLEGQAEIYEIWDKNTKTVYWFSFYATDLLDEREDPCGFPGFFPTPKPLIANPTTRSFYPVSDYVKLKAKYEQLDDLNSRIFNLTSALAVRGVYDGNSAEVKELLSSTVENKIVASKSAGQFADKGGLNKQIEFLDIGTIQGVITGLTALQEQVKAQIYELTGISDIVRGVGQKYATATAEQLKSQYASLRLVVKQGAFAQYIESLLQLKAHIICKEYAPERIVERAGVLTPADAQYVPPAIALLKQEGLRNMRLIVSVDALQLPDRNSEKAARTELLQALSQFIPGAQKMAMENPDSAPLAAKLLQFAVAGFKGAEPIEAEIQDGLKRMAEAAMRKAQQPPPPPPPSDAQIQADIEKMRLQAEDARAKGEAEIAQREAAAKMDYETKKAMGEANYKQALLEFEKQKHNDAMIIEQRKLAIEEQKVNSDKIKTIISAREAFSSINTLAGSLEDISVTPTGTPFDQAINHSITSLGAELGDNNLANKDDLSAVTQHVQGMLDAFMQKIQALASMPPPEQEIVVERTPTGLIGRTVNK